jgi:hypothetical protein
MKKSDFFENFWDNFFCILGCLISKLSLPKNFITYSDRVNDGLSNGYNMFEIRARNRAFFSLTR